MRAVNVSWKCAFKVHKKLRNIHVLVRKKRRMLSQKGSIFNQEPNEYEQKVIHNLFSETIDLNNRTFNATHLPADAVWMENAIMYNHIFSHPEDRNAHNTVFGGFLMRHALEISWALGYQFTYVHWCFAVLTIAHN